MLEADRHSEMKFPPWPDCCERHTRSSFFLKIMAVMDSASTSVLAHIQIYIQTLNAKFKSLLRLSGKCRSTKNSLVFFILHQTLTNEDYLFNTS